MNFFRIIVLVLIAYMASKDASLAVISAVALVVSLQTLNYHEANEVVASTIAEEASKLTTDTEEQVFDESEDVHGDDHDDSDHSEEKEEKEEKEEDSKIAPSSNLSTESDSEPAQVDFSKEVVNDEEEEEEEEVTTPAPPSPKGLPQGDDTLDSKFAGFMQKSNDLSSKVSDNTNEIKKIKKSLDASIKASSEHDHHLKKHEHDYEHDHEEKEESKEEAKEEEKPTVTGVKSNVSAYGGSSYASF